MEQAEKQAKSLRRLRAQADKIETRHLLVPYTEEEFEDIKSRLVQVSIKLAAKLREYEKVKSSWKAELKDVKHEF